MFTDIVGSTALRDALVHAHGENDGDRLYRERLQEPHNARIRAFLEKHRGFEVKTNGDSFMVAFASAEDAVSCAVAIQRSLRDEPIESLAIRIGMHTGAATPYERDGKIDYDGHAVNIAARVESLLKGGERVYCSRETQVLAKTPPGIRYHNYGPYALKGVSEKIEIIDVLWDASMQPVPPAQPHERLPYPWLTPWVGREREMTALEEALRANRLVTLHGTGGVGKTRTAVETLLARGGGLPREIVFVALENVPDHAAGLLDAVRTAVGLTEVDAPDLDALCRQLHGTDRLLLLDNFETVMSAADVVPRLAATAGVRVLVTSQRALDVHGERVVDLDPMLEKESYRLFVDLAQRKNATWQPDDDVAMREILVATDGLPYLIELVAPVAPKRRLRDLAKELTTVRAAHPLKERHASVTACLEWAFARLPAGERAAISKLAIFAGGFDAEAIHYIAAIPLTSLDILVDASLLRFDRGAGRYSMLPTTRQYARGLLGDNERSRLQEAHARWFIERLDKADDALRAKGAETQNAARQWIHAEYDNVQQAVEWAERQELDLFTHAVAAYCIYLDQTYRFSEIVRLNEALLRRFSFEDAPETWAVAQNNLGNAYKGLPTGDRSEYLARAIACYEAALRVWTKNDFPMLWASAQNNLGEAHRSLPTGDRSENLARAIASYEAALCVWTEYESPLDWAMTQNNLGIAYRNLPTGDRSENLARAIACYEAALRVRTEHDFPLAWAMTQNNLGVAYYSLPAGDRSENLVRAIACYEAALRVRTEHDFPLEYARTQYNLGLAYEEVAAGGQNRQHAILCYEAAARGFEAVGLKDDAEDAGQRAAALADDAS